MICLERLQCKRIGSWCSVQHTCIHHLVLKNKQRFIYADNLSHATKVLFWIQWNKTNICLQNSLHLKIHLKRRKLNIEWNVGKLKNDNSPVFLTVGLNRKVSYALNAAKVKAKVSKLNNFLGKLANFRRELTSTPCK